MSEEVVEIKIKVSKKFLEQTKKALADVEAQTDLRFNDLGEYLEEAMMDLIKMVGHLNDQAYALEKEKNEAEYKLEVAQKMLKDHGEYIEEEKEEVVETKEPEKKKESVTWEDNEPSKWYPMSPVNDDPMFG
jgi:hypothetical protein